MLAWAKAVSTWTRRLSLEPCGAASSRLLLDTLGNPAGAPREPWSLYTVDGLFDAVAEGLRRDDVIEVGYDACYDFPATPADAVSLARRAIRNQNKDGDGG